MSFELVGVKLVVEGGPNYFSTMQAADKAVTGFGSTSANTFKQMPGLADLATGALHRVGAMAVEVFAQAGQAAVGFLKDSIGVAGDFEAGMNQFSAVAGDALADAGLNIKDFRDQFIQLGKELPVSTADVQKAATEMIKGGIDPATIAAGGLKQNIQFAAAAMGGDLVAAATVSAKILGGWAEQGATADEKARLLTDATDLLTKAANASTVDVKELALGLYNVQGTAKTTGLSLAETTTALAELSPRFASSSEAGTSFKNFLIRLQPQTKNQAGAMKALGLYTEDAGSAFFDAKGEFVGVAKASQLLQTATKDLTNEQKASLLQTIFGNDAMNAAAAFAEMGAKGFDDMSAAMAKTNGVQANAAMLQQGYNTALENFHGSIEALQITIGSALLPVLTTLFNDYLAPGLNTLTTLAGAVTGDTDAFNQLSPTLQGVVTAVGMLMSGSGGLSDLWTNSLVPAAMAIGDYFSTTIAPILNDLGTALFPLLNAAVAVAAGFWSDVLLPALHAFWDLLNALVIPLIADLAHWLAENLPGAITATQEFLTGTLFPALHMVYDFIDQNVIPVIKDVVTWLEDNVPAAVQTAADFWNNTLWPALNKVWQFISANIIPIISAVVNVHFKVLGAALTTLADLWTNTLWPALQKVWAFFDDHIIPIIDALVNVWWALMKKELQILADLWTNVFWPALQKVWQFINDNIIPIFNSASKGADSLASTIKTVLGPAFTWLQDNVLKPVNEWLGTIGDTIDDLTGWLNDLADTINNLPGLPSEYEGHSPPPIAQWMTAIGEEALGASLSIGEIASAVANLPSSLPGWLSGGSLGDLFDSSGAWGNSGGGGSSGGGSWGQGITRGIASASLAGLRGGASSITNNQQRSVALTYNTAVAPPVSQSYAMSQALVGGF